LTTRPPETVLVTGAAGFVGGHLARTLVSRGSRVRALARVPERAAELRLIGIEVLQGDLQDRQSLDRAAAGVGIVYHLAGISRQIAVPASQYSVVNVEGVRSLIEAAGRAGVRRVVHCSAADVHGDAAQRPVNEDSPLERGNPYQASKLDGERVAGETARRRGLELVIARPSNVYGPGDRGLLRVFRAVARRRWITLGLGRISCHLTYVDDLVEGLRLCGDVPGASGRTYILAGPEVTSLDEFVRLIAREAGVRPPWLHLPVWPVRLAGAAWDWASLALRVEPAPWRARVDFHTRSRSFDTSRARLELGYDPRVGLREGVRRCLEWYKGRDWL
jgi:nucleoside-diphosphate-sugar epimerase